MRFFSTWIRQVVNYNAWTVSAVQAVASWAWCYHATRRTAPTEGPRAAQHGKGGASPARCIPPEQGRFAPPCTPTTRNPARFLRPSPTLRGLDARQRPVPLHRQSGSLAPRCPRVRLSRPTPRRKAFRLPTPDQPCAGWMRGNGVPRCIDIRGLSPKPSVMRFVARHLRAGRGPCTAIRHDRRARTRFRAHAGDGCSGGYSFARPLAAGAEKAETAAAEP